MQANADVRSLSSLSYRSLLRRKGRYALTAAGTALGVAVLFGVLVANRATTSALDRAILGAAGDADVFVAPVGSFDASFGDDVVARVEALPEVETAAGALVMRSAIVGPDADGLSQDDITFVRGISIDDALTIQDFPIAEGRLFEPGQPEAVVAKRLIDRHDLDVGDTVQVAVPAGLHELTIVGVLHDRDAGLSDEGRAVFVPLPVARAMHGQGDVLTSVAVALADGTDRDAWIDAHRAALGEDLALQDVDDLGSGFRTFIAAVNGALTLLSVIALFVGAFLIFLTFSLVVAEGTRVFGTLRALGAVPKQVRRLVLVEAALLGAASSIGGLAIGYGIAALTVGVTRSLLDLDISIVGVPMAPAVICVVIGVIVSAVAAWLPARRAAALSPVAAMRQGHLAAARPSRGRAGVVLLVLGTLGSIVAEGQALRSLGTLLLLLGAVLAVPPLLRPLARTLGLLTRRVASGVGNIAVMHLVKERSRSAYTLALVMVVLAMTMAVGATNQAMANTLDTIVDEQSAGNVQVFAAGAFDPAVEERLRSTPGVDASTPIRFGETDLFDGDDSSETFATVIDPATYFDVASFAWVDGGDDTARAALAAGGSVLLPDAAATALGIEIGENVTARTSSGVAAFRLAGTYAVLGSGFGLIAGVADGAAFGGGRPNGYLLGLADGVEPATVRRHILDEVLPDQAVFVDTPDMVRDAARTQLQTFFSLGYATLAIAAVVGMLGLANTLVVSVITRTREVGILRSVGVLRRQVRGMVLVEALTLALVAFVLAIPLAVVLASGIINGQRASLGITMDFVFPWAVVPVLLIVTAVLASLASLIPARRAGRLEIVHALRTD